MIGELACLAAALCWALAVAWFRAPIERYGSWAVNLAKNVLAAVLLGATAAAAGQLGVLAQAPALSIGLVAASGVAGLTIGDTALFAAVGRLGVHRTLLLQTLGPVFAAVLAHWALGETLSPRMLGGGLLVLAGVAVVVWTPRVDSGGDGAVDGSVDLARWDLVGIALGVLAAFGQGSGVVLAKRGMDDLPVLLASFVRLGAAVLGIVVVLAVAGRLRRASVTLTSAPALGRLLGPTLLGTYLAFLLMMAGVAWAPASVAAVLLAVSPVFSLCLEAWMGVAPITWRSALGTATAIAGVAVLTVA
ncbi:MAG: DMT family transporter [Acidobacteriota bacterium]